MLGLPPRDDSLARNVSALLGLLLALVLSLLVLTLLLGGGVQACLASLLSLLYILLPVPCRFGYPVPARALAAVSCPRGRSPPSLA